MRKIWHISINPLVIIVPLVCGLWLAWLHYTSATEQPVIPPNNILSNSDFNKIDANNVPEGWQITQSGVLQYRTEQTGNYHDTKAITVSVSGYTNGALTIKAPAADTQPGVTFFYKGFYTASAPFDLLIQRNYKDGTSKLQTLKQYPATNTWSTTSDVFVADANLQSVQYVYRLTANGKLQFAAPYIRPDSNTTYVKPTPALGKNLIPNPELLSTGNIRPASWSRYSIGKNQSDLKYVTDSGEPTYLQVSMSEYVDGEAKWQYRPQPVAPGQYYQFGVMYRSNTDSDIVAEYVLTSGERQFQTLQTLNPSPEWTHQSGQFEIPPGAQTMFLSIVLRSNGKVDTRAYTLQNISKSEPTYWKRPLVSFAFDSGKQSTYKNDIPLLAKQNYTGTIYINPSTLDTTDEFMSSEQVANLQAAGHEIASRGYQDVDLSTLDPQSIDYDLSHSYNYFTQTLKKNSVNFIPPSGMLNPEIEQSVRKYYESALSTDSGINTRQNFDPYNLKVFYVKPGTSSEAITKVLSEAKSSYGWVIFLYPSISQINDSQSTITTAQFQHHLDAVKQSGITVATIAEVLQEVEEQ